MRKDPANFVLKMVKLAMLLHCRLQGPSKHAHALCIAAEINSTSHQTHLTLVLSPTLLCQAKPSDDAMPKARWQAPDCEACQLQGLGRSAE